MSTSIPLLLTAIAVCFEMSVAARRVAPVGCLVASAGLSSFTRWHQLFVAHRCHLPPHRRLASLHARSNAERPAIPCISHPFPIQSQSASSPPSLVHFDVLAADFPPRQLLHTLDTLPPLPPPPTRQQQHQPQLHYQTLPPLPPPPVHPESLHKPRVAVALSGGVDSSVSAFLLREAGYAVRCVYMHNWDERDETGECSSSADRADAEAVCRHLSLPMECVEFVREYWVDVFERMVDGYRRGKTPNPDVWCNREIKFGRLLDWLRQKDGGGAAAPSGGSSNNSSSSVLLATGHYARTQRVYGDARQHGDVMRTAGQLPYVRTALRNAVDDSLAYIESLQSIATDSALTSKLAHKQQQQHSGLPSARTSARDPPISPTPLQLSECPLSLALPLLSTRLLTALDPVKDQTYFLSLVPAAALPHLLFPLGSLTKATTRAIARHAGLPTASKRDSMGICMIGRRPFNSWLTEYIAVSEGRFIDEQGREVGRHKGSEVWTVGQGARLGGQKRRWYVAAKGEDVLRSVAGSRPGDVLVVDDRLHPRLLHDDVVVGDVNWLEGEPAAVASEGRVELHCRLRSTELLRRCEVRRVDSSAGLEYSVRFLDMPHHLVSPGQTCVFYLSEYCLGGGPIVRPGLSYQQQNKKLSLRDERSSD